VQLRPPWRIEQLFQVDHCSPQFGLNSSQQALATEIVGLSQDIAHYRNTRAPERGLVRPDISAAAREGGFENEVLEISGVHHATAPSL
jgi:hypothetical protein